MKKFKKVLFGLLLSTIFLTSLDAAVTITETTNSEDGYNTIENGTIVIGITKFDSNVVLTTAKAVKAAYNDTIFHVADNPNYAGVPTYVLAGENWYEIDEDNAATKLSDDEQEELSSMEIYYVDNVEKELVVPYSNIVAEEGYKVEITTDKANKTVSTDAKAGVMKVPATVKTVEVAVVKTDDDSKVVVQTITKKNNSDASTEFVQEEATKTYVGIFQRGDSTGGTEVKAVFSGSVATFDGKIEYYRNDDSLGRIAGNRIGLKITTPKGFTSSDLSNIEVVIGERTYTFDDIKDGGNDTDGYYFLWYPLVKEGTNRSYTAKVTWAEGISEIFTVNVTDETTLVGAPQGKIEGENTYDGKVNYSVNGSEITINGKLEWAKADATLQNGRTAGNYAAVKISAPEGFDEEFLKANTTVKIDDREAVKWGNIIYGEEDTYFVYYPRFEELTDTHTVTITWENGNTQVFTIKLGENATLADPYKGTVEGVTSFDQYVNYTVEDSSVTVDGILSWTNSSDIKTGVAGNYAAVKFNAPVGYTSEEIAGATISIDEVDAGKWTSDYVYYALFNSSIKEHKVVITWQNGNSQTFTVKLGSEAKILTAPSGTIEGIKTEGVTYSVSDNTLTVGGTLKYDFANAGNYASVKITAPSKFNTNLLSGVTVKVDGEEKSNPFSSANLSTTYTFKFENKETTHTVAITWENGNTEVFTIKLDSESTLDRSVTVANETDLQKALNDENITVINVGSGFNLSNSYPEINLNRDLTIDFKGNTITAKDENGFFITKNSNGSVLTFKNGKLLAPENNEYGAIQVGEHSEDEANEASLNNTKVILAEDFTIEAKSFALTLLGSNFTVDVYGTVKSTDAFAISGNYSSHYKQDYTVNIYDNAVVISENDSAIYMPSYMTLNIYGGEITGKSAVGIKLGNLNIEGGTLTATGEKTADSDLKQTGNGFDPTGDTIYVEVNNIYYGHYQTNNGITDPVININVTGGELNSNSANIIRVLNIIGKETVIEGNYTTKNTTTTDKVVTYTSNEDAGFIADGINYGKTSLATVAKIAENIKLLDDIVVDGRVIFTDTTSTLDLGGKTLTFKAKDRLVVENTTGKTSNVTIKNGTVTGDYYALDVRNDSILNVEKDVVVDLTNKSEDFKADDKYGIVVWNSGKLNFSGTINIDGTVGKDYVGISGNGSKDNIGDTLINITGGTINVPNGYALYLPQLGTTNISGGELTGNGVIEIKSGNLNITGGILTATGEKTTPVKNSDGTSLTGGVIYIEENAAYQDNIKVNITGGTLTAKDENPIIIEYNSTLGTDNELTSEITGLYTTKNNTDDIKVFTYSLTKTSE